MASFEEAAWYFDGSGVPVGWNAGAVAFSVVPLVLSVWPLAVVATGAMSKISLDFSGYGNFGFGIG